jgi:hypothetical protein
MATLRRPLLPLALLLALVAVGASPAARADDGDAGPGDASPPAEEGGVPPPLHKVYVPYKDLRKIFEREGEGVFVPAEEFRELWKRAWGGGGDGTKPPVPVALHAATYEGEADGDVIRLTARLDVEVLRDGWQ